MREKREEKGKERKGKVLQEIKEGLREVAGEGKGPHKR